MFTFENHGFAKMVACYEYSYNLRKALKERFDSEQVDEVFNDAQVYLKALCPEPSDHIPSEAVCAACRCITESIRNDWGDLVIRPSHIEDGDQFLAVLDYLRENGVRQVVLAFGGESNSFLFRALNHGWHATGTGCHNEVNELMKDREYKGVILSYRWSN